MNWSSRENALTLKRIDMVLFSQTRMINLHHSSLLSLSLESYVRGMACMHAS